MVTKKKATIYEVAREAGVSRQTVSRVINGRPDVAPETRKRVKEVIEKLGYRPSAIARSLSQRRSYTFGVVTAGLKYIGPSRTLSGITEQSEELGYGLLLKELTSFSANNVHPLLQWFIAHQVDGIIWAAPEIGENRSWLDTLLGEIHIPILFLTMEKRKDVSVVSIDNYLGAKEITNHLIGLGRKNIGHVSGPLDWWEARQRKQGWMDALSEKGFPCTDKMWTEGNWSSKSGKLAFQELYEKFPEMDAVFVGNDQMACSVLQTAFEKNIRVPQDLAVAGFDGIAESEFFSPALTTVFQNQHDLGCTAVQELANLVENRLEGEGEIKPRQILLEPELLVRQSTQVSI
jgi:LacI family transcriptional regulator